MNFKNKASQLIVIVCGAAVAMLLMTLFANDSTAVDGNQVAKREFFALSSICLSVVGIMTAICGKLKITIIDVLVICLAIYSVVTYHLLGSLAESRQIIILLLSALYLNIRLIFAFDKRIVRFAVICIMLSGVAESIIGIWQLLGDGVSNHNLYTVTGSFFNPGPYGGYLAVIAAIALSIVTDYYQDKFRWSVRSVIFIFSFAALFLTLLLLPASMGRTAWAAFGVSVITIAALSKQIRRYVTKHRIASVIILIVIVCGIAGAYTLKRNSANGRFVTWNIGCEAVSEKPLLGSGTGHFAHSFTEAQIHYFSSNPEMANYAGSPEYAFNELLQITIEYGIIGLLLFVAVVIISLHHLLRGNTFKRALGIGLIAMVVFSSASYPFNLLPFLITFVMMIAASSDNTKGCEVGLPIRLIIALGTTVVCVYGFIKIDSQPYREWRSVQSIYQSKNYQAVEDDYRELYPQLKDNAKFLFEYGHTLGFTGHEREAIAILERGATMSCDPMFYNIIGNCHKNLGEITAAEQSYNRAYDLLPTRVYPLYLLVKLYYESSDSIAAKIAAERVMEHKDKVESPATRQIRQEVETIYKELTK